MGERVRFGDAPQTGPDSENKCVEAMQALTVVTPDARRVYCAPGRVQKKKIWEAVQPDLRTSAAGAASWKDLPMLTSAGPVGVKRILNGSIS